MALVNFTQLDFDQIKRSLKEYLRANSNFTDYDFEGSNLATIVDVLAYNTYISSYNANMVSSEVFIDGATLRENVVSLARNVGYVPRSRLSAKSNISFFVDTTTLTTAPISLTLKSGTVCTTRSSFSNTQFSFCVLNDVTVPVVNGIAFFDSVEIYEGNFIATNFTVDANNPFQRYILDNPNVDTNTITVQVRDTQSSTFVRKFIQSNSLFDIDGRSRVYFIQEIEDQRYELIFGDGIFGAKLENDNYIEVSYLISSGEEANGSSDFTYTGRIIDNAGRVVNTGISLITTNTKAAGGTEIESVDSVKKYAARIYSSQNRAVTATDYEALIGRLYPEVQSLSVFGGEDLSPPRYGKVFISVKPVNGDFLSSQVKDNLKDLIKKYSVAGIVTEIIDLKYLYVEFDSAVYYNVNFAPGANSVKTIVSQNIESYSKSTELNKYGARFKYSKFLKIIDDSHEAVTSNITKIIIRRDLQTKINELAEYEICFGNQFHIKDNTGFNIKSSGFQISGIPGTLYLSDAPNPDGKTGSIFFFRLNSDTEFSIVKSNAGTIDYVKGEIMISPVNFISTLKNKGINPIIEISAIPKSNDVIGLQDLYLQLDINSSIVSVVPDQIESGSDISGSNYITSSSYTNGNLVRK